MLVFDENLKVRRAVSYFTPQRLSAQYLPPKARIAATWPFLKYEGRRKQSSLLPRCIIIEAHGLHSGSLGSINADLRILNHNARRRIDIEPLGGQEK